MRACFVQPNKPDSDPKIDSYTCDMLFGVKIIQTLHNTFVIFYLLPKQQLTAYSTLLLNLFSNTA